VLESRLNYPGTSTRTPFSPRYSTLTDTCSPAVSLSPYAKISYASKPFSAAAYKAGQATAFQKDFDAAAAPVESSGFCERELSVLGSLMNTQSDLCGRFKQVDTNVGFLLQLEFVEPSPVVTSWSWYLGLPFRLGNGAVVVLDGMVVQDLLGKTGYWKGVLSKTTQVDMKLTPGFHVLKIYGLSAKFETSSVYFSREGSTPAVASVYALVSELTKWSPFVAPDSATSATLTTEQANKASSVGRAISVLQFQNAPVDGRFALHIETLSTSDGQSAKVNTSSMVSFSFLPATAFAIAKASRVSFATAANTQWGLIPGLTMMLPASSSGVLICSFTGRFFVDKNAVNPFRLDIGFGASAESTTSQFRLDESFIDPSGVPLDFSYFTSVSTASSLSTSVSYRYQGEKTGKIIGGRTTAVFVPGASLLSDTFSDSTVSLAKTIFSSTVSLLASSSLIIRVAGIICRNSATEILQVWISKNGDHIYDGNFSAVSGVVTSGFCEPLAMHSVVDAIAGLHTIAVDVTTSTNTGYQLKGVQMQIAMVERGALLSQDLCQSRCTQHRLCRLGVYNAVTKACSLHMIRNTSPLEADSIRTTFIRGPEPDTSDNAWSMLRNTKWFLSQNVSMVTKCKGDACVCSGTYTLKDQCRCICQASNDCVGFSNSDGICVAITAADLRQNIQLGTYNSSGGTTVHLNMPQTCHAIKLNAPSAVSGRYVIATTTGFYDAFCNMTADSGEGYTVVPCDLGGSDVNCRSSTGPKDSDSCKAMGLRQVVPRSSSHFVSLHRKYGSLFFSTVPGVTNAYIGDTVDLPSDEETVLDWVALDGGKWWLRDNGSNCDVMSPSSAPNERRWLGMHLTFNGQSTLDGLALNFDPRGLVTTKYLCSTNDVSPSVSWSYVLQDSFIGSGDDNLWVASWTSADKWYQLCQGIVILGGKPLSRNGAFIKKSVIQIKTDKPTNVRITFTYYFVFDPLYWPTLLLKSSEPKVIRIFLGSQLIRQVQIDTSTTYACYGQSSTAAQQAYFYRGRERFVVRGFNGGANELRFETDFGSLSISAFGIDEVSLELESSFKSPLGLSTTSPAVSCVHLMNERALTGDPNPDGQYYIQLDPSTDPVLLPCSDGWIVAQRRVNGKTTFNRNWNEYREGFGLGSSSEWWLGNDILSAITARSTEAMVVLSKDYQEVFALYSDFHVASESEKYLLTVRGYNSRASNAADGLAPLTSMYFSSPDHDNDLSASQNCAQRGRSGFWYDDCSSSTRSDLNAPFEMLPICNSYSAWARSWCQKTGSIVWDNADGYDSSKLLLRPAKCAPGFVGARTGACTQCPAGTFAEPQSEVCNMCLAGTYGPSAGLSGASACISCPAGFKCPSGSTSPEKCSAGTFADSGSSQCSNVPEGYAGPFDQMSPRDLVLCTNGSFSKPGQQKCSAIPAGFYCPSITAVCGYSTLVPCPSRSVYCPEGNTGPISVPPGYTSVGSLANEQQSQIMLCPRGFYCLRGAKYLCPPTCFGDQEGLVSSICSGRCAAGCVCKAGSVSRCPDVRSGTEQVALLLSTITYTMAPLSKQPGDTDATLIQDVASATGGAAGIQLDIFEFKDINITSFKTGWTAGFAHNISISYFEQSQTDLTYEVQVPVAGFDWGALVSVDGQVVAPRSKSGMLAFSFVSSWGRHVLSIIGAEAQFLVSRTILLRKTPTAKFSILRCDRLDGQPVSISIEISLCAATASNCKGYVSIDGSVQRTLGQNANTLEVLVYSELGAPTSSVTTDASVATNYMPLLSAMSPGGVAILIGENLGNLPSSLRGWLTGYGVSRASMDSVVSGFVFVGVNDNTTPGTFEVISAGSSYKLQLTLPLSQASSYYGFTNVPTGYYASPEDAPNARRYEIRKCPAGYSCSGGVRQVAFVFPDSICVNRKHDLDILENSDNYVSEFSFSLISSPAGLTYDLQTATSAAGIFRLAEQNHIAVVKALNYEDRSGYDITLMVRETSVSVSYAACLIHVNVVDVNEAPSITNYQVTRTIKENTLAPVALMPALEVADPDSYDSYTFAIASGDNGVFVVNRDGTIIATKTIDFENTPQFMLDVVVKDQGGLEGHASVTIAVLDVPEPPICAPFTFSVAESTAIGSLIGTLSGYALDPDVSDSMVYELMTQSPQETISIDVVSGKVTLRTRLNYEHQDAASFAVRFTDRTGLHTTCDFFIAVTDSNDAPVLTSTVFCVTENCVGNECLVGDLADFAVDEDEGSVLTFSLVSENEVLFIDGSRLWVATPLDFEDDSVLKITVSVQDERGASDEATMTVQIVDINEAPRGMSFTKTIAENVPVGTVVCSFEAIDPEGDHVLYAISHADDKFKGLFAVKGGDLVTKMEIDYEALTHHMFTVTISACDPMGLCTEIGPNTVEVTDAPDAPVLEQIVSSVSIPENAGVGAAVDASISFSDEDNGQSAELLYSIYSGDPLNQFSVSAHTGALTVKSLLNAEIASEYAIVIQATDPDGLSGFSTPIDIAVEMIPSPPFFVGTAVSQNYYKVDVSQLQDGSYVPVMIPVSDRDPDQAGGVCSVTRDPTSSFIVTTTVDNTACEVSVLENVYIPDTERLNITLRVTDLASSSLFSEVTIGVLSRNLNHPPKCADAQAQLMENSPYGIVVGAISGSDPDTIDTISYYISSSTNADVFQVDSTTGVVTVGTRATDFESQRQHTLKIRVQDDTVAPLTGSCTYTIDILNELESPECPATILLSIAEHNDINDTVGNAVWRYCIDPDTRLGNSTAFRFDVVGSNQALRVDPVTGKLSATKVFDYEEKATYNIVLIVRNAFRPTKSTSIGVNLKILDKNDPPQLAFQPLLPSSTAASVDVPESSVVGTSIGQLILYDEDKDDGFITMLVDKSSTFSLEMINATVYNLVLAKQLDYETRARYSVKIIVKDTSAATTTLSVDVRIVDVNEPPFFEADQHFFIEENVPVRSIPTSMFRSRGPCLLGNEEQRIEYRASVNYGNCMQRCVHVDACQAGVFKYSSSECNLYSKSSFLCEPCDDCEGFERIAKRAANKALSISAVTLNVKQANPLPAPDTSFSLEAWIAVRSNEGSLVSWRSSSGISPAGLQLEYMGGSLRIIVHGITINTEKVLTPTLWYHVAVTYDRLLAELKVYLDGILILEQYIVSRTGVTWGTSSTLSVGNCVDGVSCPPKVFEFSIDEVCRARLRFMFALIRRCILLLF
jgi:hypothetical protein